MANIFVVANRLRLLPEFSGVTDDTFLQLAGGDRSGRPASTNASAPVIRGRQRILSALLAKRERLAVTRLIDARKTELRHEIKNNTPDGDRAAHEAAFNALFDKLVLTDLQSLGFGKWLDKRGISKSSAESAPPFTDAVDFLLCPLVETSTRESVSKTKTDHCNSVKSKRTPAEARVSHNAKSGNELKDKIESVSKAPKAASSFKVPAIEEKQDARDAKIAQLESQLQEARHECAVLRGEVANLQELLGRSLEGEAGGKCGDRAGEYLRWQTRQMMRHVLEMRELGVVKNQRFA
ncbi:hypothetical protein HDU84_001102 [Entophlyctis sp. JEL0112]|nr:hypothetical protein HDU84_001102 [Entophlyctis sp. JEL0112]